MALAGRLGGRINLDRVPSRGLGMMSGKAGGKVDSLTSLLYAESASRLLVTVTRDKALTFQEMFKTSLGFDAALIGNVSDAQSLILTSNDTVVLESPVNMLAQAFKATLNW